MDKKREPKAEPDKPKKTKSTYSLPCPVCGESVTNLFSRGTCPKCGSWIGDGIDSFPGLKD